jgi:hypothetical protein
LFNNATAGGTVNLKVSQIRLTQRIGSSNPPSPISTSTIYNPSPLIQIITNPGGPKTYGSATLVRKNLVLTNNLVGKSKVVLEAG